MLKNYITVAFRNLWRNKMIASINVAGLSIGLACCMLILLYVDDDWSIDRFNQQRDRIYQVTMQVLNSDGSLRAEFGRSGTVFGPSFQQVIPEINAYTRICTYDFVAKKDEKVFTQHVHFADANFFSVFTFPVVSGDPNTALADLHGMVLSEETAKKYFGGTDVIGKILEFQVDKTFIPFTVTAVAKDCPQNSTIKFDVLLPLKYYQSTGVLDDWMNFDVNTFLLLKPGADPNTTLTKMTRVYQAESAPALRAAHDHGIKSSFNLGLLPLTAVHLAGRSFAIDNRSIVSEPLYGYILSAIAGFILLIACINFINLTVSQSQKRSKEIGIRKVVGGSRAQLIWQFLGESFVACGISFALAICLMLWALPVFNELAGKRLSLSYLLDTRLVGLSIAFYLLTAFAAGFYPALVLSGFNPIDILYRRFRLKGTNYLGKGLAVVQFSIAGLFIISTIFMAQQFYYLTHKDLGYNDNDLITVNIATGDPGQFAAQFRHQLLINPSIRAVARYNSHPDRNNSKVGDRQVLFSYEHIDEHYFDALQVPVIKGRNFSPDFPADSANSVIINEAFAGKAGWDDPIGKTIESPSSHKPVTVVGVIRDFNYYPLTSGIDPQVFTMEAPREDLEFNIRVAPADRAAALSFVGTTFKKLAPYYPFSYAFKQDENLHAYDAQEKWKQIVGFAAIFTTFISCIGLFGLTMLSTQRRIKEVGIRKVLGASVPHLVRVLSMHFLKLVLLANLIAIPVAWWAINKWLQNFAYRITLHWWVFAGAMLITFLLAGLTIGFRALRSAVANPVNNLRVE
jgi:putative ABC transport system permease protein